MYGNGTDWNETRIYVVTRASVERQSFAGPLNLIDGRDFEGFGFDYRDVYSVLLWFQPMLWVVSVILVSSTIQPQLSVGCVLRTHLSDVCNIEAWLVIVTPGTVCIPCYIERQWAVFHVSLPPDWHSNRRTPPPPHFCVRSLPVWRSSVS
jgi:hypothetical protein